eukprot:Gb_15796 [translate_table: standard]
MGVWLYGEVRDATEGREEGNEAAVGTLQPKRRWKRNHVAVRRVIRPPWGRTSQRGNVNACSFHRVDGTERDVARYGIQREEQVEIVLKPIVIEKFPIIQNTSYEAKGYRIAFDIVHGDILYLRLIIYGRA